MQFEVLWWLDFSYSSLHHIFESKILGFQFFFPKYIENTFQAIQSTFRYLDMHSKRRYKICICSVILGWTWVFSKLQRLQYYFTENFRCNLKYYDG